jgi:hypothetical protein
MLPFLALPFHFWVEMVEPAFINIHDVEQEVITLGSMSLTQL